LREKQLTSSSQQNASFSADIESPELAGIIAYPQFTEANYSTRIAEMKALGISSITLGGRTTIGGKKIAGKGCVGLVVRAEMGGKTCALKIRRTDADRKSMHEEVRLHLIANQAGVGPRIEGYSDNLIAMEFIEGDSIAEWEGSEKEARKMARSVLEQCYSLDRAGIDHGELSRLDRHVIVSDSPTIIDFESASTARKMCNVTAAAQSIFLHGAVAAKMQAMLGRPDRERALAALKTYKRDQTRSNFDAVLGSLSI
jgi:putative serine/threonine protein kinase